MRPKLWPAFGHWVTSQNPEGGASRSSQYDFPLMRTKLFKKPHSPLPNPTGHQSFLPCVDHYVLVLSRRKKQSRLRMRHALSFSESTYCGTNQTSFSA